MITHDPDRVGYTRMDEKQEQKDTWHKKWKCFKSCYLKKKTKQKNNNQKTTLNVVLDTI